MLLNEAVERKSFKSVGSRFKARGVAAEKALKSVGSRFKARSAAAEKALSPIFRLVLGKSQLLDECSDDRAGMSEAGVNRLAM